MKVAIFRLNGSWGGTTARQTEKYVTVCGLVFSSASHTKHVWKHSLYIYSSIPSMALSPPFHPDSPPSISTPQAILTDYSPRLQDIPLTYSWRVPQYLESFFLSCPPASTTHIQPNGLDEDRLSEFITLQRIKVFHPSNIQCRRATGAVARDINIYNIWLQSLNLIDSIG